jgi:hypothetical protein
MYGMVLILSLEYDSYLDYGGHTSGSGHSKEER